MECVWVATVIDNVGVYKRINHNWIIESIDSQTEWNLTFLY